MATRKPDTAREKPSEAPNESTTDAAEAPKKHIEIEVPGGTARVSPQWAKRWPDDATKSKED